jgi:hypothetical protein
MIYAISKNLILPPTFNWYTIKFNKEFTKANRFEITKDHVLSVIKILDDTWENLPNKKIIGWAGTIAFSEKWKTKLEEHLKDSKNLKKLKIYLDHSKSEADADGKTDYTKFRDSESNCMLICANKHREGSDIKKLDCCIFLDRCKTRSPIPFIQSIGRVLRTDSNCKEKKTGVIIDGFIDTCDEYAKFLIDKIYGYYLALENVSGNQVDDTKEEKYIRMMEMIDFDSKNKKIKLKGLDLEINSNQIDWKDISKKFDEILKTKLTPEKVESFEFNKLKKQIKKLKFVTKKEYTDYADENDLCLNPDIQYKFLWKGWYDFLNVNLNIFPKTSEELAIKCKEYGISNDNYHKKIVKYKEIPEFPNEIYNGFSNIKLELEKLDIHYNELI